jgi:L-seryl-tRNA(Ser) seleniumtransferase
VPVTSKADLYRQLPSVDELLRSPELAFTIEREGRASVADAARSVLGSLRTEIAAARLDAGGVRLALSGISGAVERQIGQSLGYSLRPVINATGVVLHTNLGRAPLSLSAWEHMRDAASGYSNLEFDVDTGERG